MKHRSSGLPIAVLATMLIIAMFSAPPAHAGTRLIGSAGIQSYGYQDAADENHLWLIPSLSFSTFQTGGPWSLHTSANYLGDNADDFSTSGRTRLLKGYLQYGRIGQPLQAKVGRFFLARGVALGVFDGADVSYQVAPRIRVSGFAGMVGPLNRQFQTEDPSQALSFGGEVRITPSRCLLPARGILALSFVRSQREEGVVRDLIGLQTYHRFNARPITWMNTFQIRPTANPLRKWISRARYGTEALNAMAEVGIVGFDAAEYSWFSDFGSPPRIRTRIAADYYFVPEEWAGGFEAQVLLAGGKNGFRGGPVVSSPWGQVGYRLSGGDLGTSSGPWANVQYRPMTNLELFAYAAMVTYQWDTFDIESNDLTSLLYGGRWTPGFAPSLTVSLQVQVYTSPELSYDQRMLGGLSWRFDTGRTRR
ncbi:MAG: hypothetical protein V2A56_05145 [bacterium]